MAFTIEKLRGILIAASGAPEIEVADADFADTPFEALGYDSLALMETATVITRDYGVDLPDETLYSAKTPGELVSLVQSSAKAPA